MIVYPEASLLVAAFSSEVMSEKARCWLADASTSTLATSAWCETEIASALAVKVRRGELAADALRGALGAALTVIRSSALIIPVERRQFEDATDLIRRSPAPLRAGDALHLAIARARDAVVWTLDQGMAQAGQALGLGTRLLA